MVMLQPVFAEPWLELTVTVVFFAPFVKVELSQHTDFVVWPVLRLLKDEVEEAADACFDTDTSRRDSGDLSLLVIVDPYPSIPSPYWNSPRRIF